MQRCNVSVGGDVLLHDGLHGAVGDQLFQSGVDTDYDRILAISDSTIIPEPDVNKRKQVIKNMAGTFKALLIAAGLLALAFMGFSGLSIT